MDELEKVLLATTMHKDQAIIAFASYASEVEFEPQLPHHPYHEITRVAIIITDQMRSALAEYYRST